MVLNCGAVLGHVGSAAGTRRERKRALRALGWEVASVRVAWGDTRGVYGLCPEAGAVWGQGASLRVQAPRASAPWLVVQTSADPAACRGQSGSVKEHAVEFAAGVMLLLSSRDRRPGQKEALDTGSAAAAGSWYPCSLREL